MMKIIVWKPLMIKILKFRLRNSDNYLLTIYFFRHYCIEFCSFQCPLSIGLCQTNLYLVATHNRCENDQHLHIFYFYEFKLLMLLLIDLSLKCRKKPQKNNQPTNTLVEYTYCISEVGKNSSPTTSARHITLKNLILWLLQCCSFKKCWVLLNCHHSQVNSDPEWKHLIGSYLWIKWNELWA